MGGLGDGSESRKNLEYKLYFHMHHTLEAQRRLMWFDSHNGAVENIIGWWPGWQGTGLQIPGTKVVSSILTPTSKI